MSRYYSDDLAELWHHDARRVSEIIEPGSVDLVVTSPPYFALRSYRDGGEHYDGQVGSEATPAAFIDALIECTADWVKVLRPTGSMFVNLGDKRANDAKWGGATGGKHVAGLHGHTGIGRTKMSTGIPAKSRMLLPHRYAIACLDRLNLIVRSDIVWSKPNGLPESVTDRCRDSHEYIFQLNRQGRYFAAIDEVREAQDPANARPNTADRSGIEMEVHHFGSSSGLRNGEHRLHPLGKLPGSVWTISSEPLVVPDHLGVDHFAAFPSELPRRCILGWTPPGYCLECGQARRPIVDRQFHGEYNDVEARRQQERYVGVRESGGFNRVTLKRTDDIHRTIVGYACDCPTPDAPTRPAVVLDPFAGTGTTIAAAKALGRRGIGIDLSRDYLRLAEWRINDDALRRKVLERSGVKVPQPPAHNGQEVLFT